MIIELERKLAKEKRLKVKEMAQRLTRKHDVKLPQLHEMYQSL